MTGEGQEAGARRAHQGVQVRRVNLVAVAEPKVVPAQTAASEPRSGRITGSGAAGKASTPGRRRPARCAGWLRGGLQQTGGMDRAQRAHSSMTLSTTWIGAAVALTAVATPHTARERSMATVDVRKIKTRVRACWSERGGARPPAAGMLRFWLGRRYVHVHVRSYILTSSCYYNEAVICSYYRT